MARIRSIKPEFAQSESMGRVSREARLCFVLLWTISDDEGRLRGNSRMLASLLYPYDNDAGDLIDAWLAELEAEGCVRRYRVADSAYLQIEHWRAHQRIDKPTPSRLPKFEEGSPLAREDSATPREDSRALPAGREGKGRERKGGEASQRIATVPRKPRQSESLIPADFAISDRVRQWAAAKGHGQLEARFEHFVGYAKANGAKYVDWDEAFMNAIRGNWAKLATDAVRSDSQKMQAAL